MKVGKVGCKRGKNGESFRDSIKNLSDIRLGPARGGLGLNPIIQSDGWKMNRPRKVLVIVDHHVGLKQQ